MSAHRYWRIYGRFAGDGTDVNAAEIELRETSGGADATGSGTALFSAQNAGEVAANAFDNNVSTYWQDGTHPSNGGWIGYDFGAGVTKDITEVSLQTLSGFSGRAFHEFDIQYSDNGTAWTTLWSVSQPTWTNAAQVFTKPTPAAASRYWRVRALKSFSPATNILELYELQLRSAVNGADQTAPGGTITARTTFSGWPASQAIDNNLTVGYASSGTSADQSEWLSYDFGAGVTKTIVEATIFPRNDGNWVNSPTTLVVEYSSDQINWLEAWRVSDTVGSQGYTVRYIAPASVPSAGGGKHRFWGIRTNATGGATTPGVAELWLYTTTVGGTVITTGGTGVSLLPASSSTGGLAFDGNTATEYGGRTVGDILAYDLGQGNETTTPLALKVRARSGLQTQAPTNFDLVYSDDGSTWTVQQNFTTPSTWASSEERTFTVTPPIPPRRRPVILT